ncbi:MAG: methionine--tRNA ligase [Trueperaceae bacterium]|nr:MAG: methionine--tRNA ligase [Trueperaceae bacterium]
MESEATVSPQLEELGKEKERATYYATTPIFYVNAEPHIGHAYTTILVDVVTRFHRLKGDDTYFLTGTDEHGEKVQKAAEAHGMSPEEYTDKVAAQFRDTWDRLDIRYDEFIRTTEDRHKRVVQEILQRVYDNGDIFYGEYSGLYCVGAERFVTEKELVDGKCPDSDSPPEHRSEANYFFRMEKYRPWLREYIEDNPDFIRPGRYKNEVLAMLREPIGDLSISRPRSRVPWGIPLPWDEDHVTYVWFDALINYYSALVSKGLEGRYWPHVEHFIAKDIVKPHGVFWPTMLKAAGLPLYQHLNVHGYWLHDERKMSKSIGNVVRPLELQQTYGNDAFRYFLLRDMTFGLDASFGELGLAERINSDLANDLGNLLNRTLGMVSKYCDGAVPRPGMLEPIDEDLKESFTRLPEVITAYFDNLQFERAIEAVLEAVRKANKYISDTQPWALAKDEGQHERLATVLNTCVEALRCASILLEPIIPHKAQELRKQLGIRRIPYDLASSGEWNLVPAGTQTQPGPPLFPKIDLDALGEEEQEAPAQEDLEEPPRAQTAAVPETAPPPATSPEEPGNTAPTLSHKQEIGIDDFAKLELRVATILKAEEHPKADKLLVLTVRLGPEQRTVVSGIKEHYQPLELVGKKIVLVTNLKPVKLRGITSQGMILAAEDEQGSLSIATLDRDVADGSEVN